MIGADYITNNQATPMTSSFGTPSIPWADIQDAVNNRDIKKLFVLGKKFGKPRIQQEGVKVDEVVDQIMSMAPGHHPMLGPCLLDLAEKLKKQR